MADIIDNCTNPEEGVLFHLMLCDKCFEKFKEENKEIIEDIEDDGWFTEFKGRCK